MAGVDPPEDQPFRRSAIGLLPMAFTLGAMLSLALGYVGFYLYPETHDKRPLDLLYDALQLFVLGSSPLDESHGPYPIALEIARLGAPAVTVYAFVQAGRLLFAAEVQRFRARTAREHTIVCGDGLVARAVARRAIAAGRRVVTVSTVPLGPPGSRARGPLRVVGDGRDPDVLRAAGVDRAATLYACTDDSATNTAIALAAARRSTPAVYALVTDPDLCLALQARYLGAPPAPAVRLDFFNVDDLAARKLLADHPPRPVAGRPPRVLVLGATAFGRAVLVETARRWRVDDPAGSSRLPVVVVDEHADRAVAEVSHRYPFLSEVCDVAAHQEQLPDETPDRVFVCYDDEERALTTALTVERLWHGGPRSVVVRLDRLAGLGRAEEHGTDEVSATLHLFAPVHAACDPVLIADDLVERLARVIHDSYLLDRRLRGDAAADDPAMVTWDELPEPLRQANRAQAGDVGRKLRAIHCVLSPRIEPGEGYTPTSLEVEELARMEHARWVAERAQAGWRYAPNRDDNRLLHPGLVDWGRVSEATRIRSRDAVRQLPVLLGDAGFRILRLPDRST